MTMLADAVRGVIDVAEAVAEAPVAPGVHRPAGAVLDGQPWARSWPEFIRAITRHDDASARNFIANAVMDERIPVEGGFLVPEVLRQEVLHYMTAAIVRPRATVLPMSTLRLPVPLLDNSTQASAAQALGGMTFATTAEGAAIAGSNPNFGRIVLEAWKVAGLLSNVPNELVNDAAGAFGDLLARVIAAGYAWYEDDVFIGGTAATGTGGTGTGQPQGLINAPGAKVISRGTASEVLFADIIAMYKGLHPATRKKASLPGQHSVCWLLSASAMDWLLELFYNPTGTEVVPPPQWFTTNASDQGACQFLGIPAFVTDHQPAVGTQGDVVLADLELYLIGDRQVMTIDPSPAGPSFVFDATDYRVKSRVDGRFWYQSAITTETGQTVAPLVVLK